MEVEDDDGEPEQGKRGEKLGTRTGRKRLAATSTTPEAAIAVMTQATRMARTHGLQNS
jgi:hypothetical protein